MLVDKQKALDKLNSPENLIYRVCEYGNLRIRQAELESGPIPEVNNIAVPSEYDEPNPPDRVNAQTDVDSLGPIGSHITDDGSIIPTKQRSRPNDVHDNMNKLRPGGDGFDEHGVSIRPAKNGGRRDNDLNVPEEIRQLIALDTTNAALDIKDSLGVSEQTIANIRGPKGIGLKDEFKQQLSKKVQTAQDKAIDKMLEAFQYLDFNDEAKMRRTSLRDLSTVMVNMSRVVETGKDRDISNDRARVIVYAPEVKQVNNYGTVSVDD